jgi:hypothetical protein
MPKFSCGKCVRILAVLFGMLQVSFVILLIILSSFLISGFEKGTA